MGVLLPASAAACQPRRAAIGVQRGYQALASVAQQRIPDAPVHNHNPLPRPSRPQVHTAATVGAPAAQAVDWATVAAGLDSKSPLVIMDHVGGGPAA